MAPPAIVPNGVIRTFGTDEIIVSKTDPQGRITYVNDVFLHVSRFDEHEVIGRPHNLIRHPDMPRAVFGLLWEEIKAGREIFAYVNNLAKDGASYWVLAHVTPTIADGRIVGFHSNRRSPDRSAIREVEPLYRQLLTEERRHQRPGDALAASRAALDLRLKGLGVTYDQLVWSLTGASKC